MKLKKAGLRNGLVLGTVTGVAFGLVSVIGVGTASASPAVTLDYTCKYPLIGSRSVKLKIETNLPAKIGVGQNPGKIQVKWTALLGADTTSGLNAVDGATIEGAATAKATVTSPDFPTGLNVNVRNAWQPRAIPADGAFELTGYGEAPGFDVATAGHGTAKLGDMEFTVTLRKKDNSSSALGTFKAQCTPASGNPTVAEFDDEGEML